MRNPYLEDILKLLDPPAVPVEQTSKFKGVAHDKILYAYKNWIEYLKLLIREPISVEIIQGQQDEGVDLIVTYLVSNMKIGLQVKSNNEIVNDDFRSKIMSQITYSRKHGLSKLLIAPCADLKRRSQDFKVRNLMSQMSQLGDDYVIILQPQKILPIWLSFSNNKHPLVYLKHNKKVIDLIQGLSESLSTEDYTARVSVTFDYKVTDSIQRPYGLNIVFKPFLNENENTAVDKLTRLQNLQEAIEFSGNEIDELILTHPDGSVEKIKPSFLRAIPEKKTIGPFNLYTKADNELMLGEMVLNELQSNANYIVYASSKEILPWTFRITISNREKVSINFGFNLQIASFRDFKLFNRFMESLRGTPTVVLENSSKQKFDLDVHSSNYPNIEPTDILLIDDLATIEEKLGLRFSILSDPKAYNAELIKELASFLKAGKIEKRSRSYPANFEKQDAIEILEQIKSKSKLDTFDLDIVQMGVKILGQEVLFGPVKIRMKNVVLEGDIAEMETRTESLAEDDSIEFTVKSDGTVKDVYELIPSEGLRGSEET